MQTVQLPLISSYRYSKAVAQTVLVIGGVVASDPNDWSAGPSADVDYDRFYDITNCANLDGAGGGTDDKVYLHLAASGTAPGTVTLTADDFKYSVAPLETAHDIFVPAGFDLYVVRGGTSSAKVHAHCRRYK